MTFQPDAPRILLMIAAYNEEDNIESVVDTLVSDYPQYDYVIINDGSTDRTHKICERRGYNYLKLPIHLGIGGAIQTGYLYAREFKYDIAVQLDGDGQHDPAYIARLVEPILKGEAEYTIGSRFVSKEQREGFRSTVMRRAGIRFLSGLIHLLTFRKIYDVTSGFRAVNRRMIRIFCEDYSSDYPEPDAIVTALMNLATIREIPVVMRERIGGRSSINLKASIYYMIKVTLNIIICRISYGIRRGKREELLNG